MELPLPQTWLELGDRCICFEGLPSQFCGTVVGFSPCYGAEGVFPVVLCDDGIPRLLSYEWRLRKLAEVEQLSLFEGV